MIFSVTSIFRKLISHWSRSVVVGRSNLTRRRLRLQVPVGGDVVRRADGQAAAAASPSPCRMTHGAPRGSGLAQALARYSNDVDTVTVLSLKVNSSGDRVSSAATHTLGLFITSLRLSLSTLPMTRGMRCSICSISGAVVEHDRGADVRVRLRVRRLRQVVDAYLGLGNLQLLRAAARHGQQQCTARSRVSRVTSFSGGGRRER